MNMNKKTYLKPSTAIVLLETQSHMLTSTIYTRDAAPGYSGTDMEITSSDEIL